MATMNQSSARTRIDVAEASEIARMARTGDPNILSRDDMESLLGHSALVLDGLRRRPRYFDGRFLTGADLTRDQEYIRQRQGDLARASGTGVVNGLLVGMVGSAGGELLTITPGHGITPSGEIVTVMTRRQIAPLDLPAVERLDATMGLRLSPAMPLGRRTGLFLLVLRAVEFTANPIAAYPTSINGPRRIEDGDVIEATAITLIPYPDNSGAASLAEARRAVARQLFLGDAHGMPQDALPLAMIAMERGAIRWVDMPMVRRETGADTPLQVGMGARPRALSEAFVLQHRRHLADVLHDRAASALPPAFSAMQYFSALPAAGQLPAAAITTDPLGFQQMWFPPAVDVDLSFVPGDEIAALVEESLTMPPIDLLADPLDLDATGVVVLAPVSRPMLQRFDQALTQLSMRAVSDPGQGIRRAPAQMLAAMLSRRTKFLEAARRDAAAVARAEAEDAEIRTWQTAWAEAVAAIDTSNGLPPLLWYVRRRSVPYASRVAGIAVTVTGDDASLATAVRTRLNLLGLASRITAVTNLTTPFAEARLLSFLGAPRVLNSAILMTSAVHDLEAMARTINRGGETVAAAAADTISAELARKLDAAAALRDVKGSLATRGGTVLTGVRADTPGPIGKQPITEGDVMDVASTYADPRLGEGLERIAEQLGETTPMADSSARWIGDTGKALELDRAARDVRPWAFAKFATDLVKLADDKDSDGLALLIANAG